MPFLTRRQFIDWPIERLIAEISRGLRPNVQYIKNFINCRLKITDAVFVEKFITLIPFCIKECLYGVINRIDKLPFWMFAKIMTTIQKYFDIYDDKTISPHIFENVNNVDNIVFCLLAGMKISYICWSNVYPLNKLWILRPWLPQDYTGLRFFNNQTGAIMGVCKPYNRIFHAFETVKNIVKYGTGKPYIWRPTIREDFEGFSEFYLKTMLIEGWFIIINMARNLDVHLPSRVIHRVMVNMRCQYQLYDKAFKYGESNRTWYRAIREKDVTADIQENPAKYTRWRSIIALKGFECSEN